MRLVEKKISNIILCGIFASVFAFFSANTYALDISQQDLVVSDHSSTITIHNTGISSGSSQITPKLEFNKLGDFITYKLTLHNNDGKKFKITEVKDNNTNDAIELAYSYPVNIDITDKAIEFTIKYVKKFTSPFQSVTIMINLVDEDDQSQQININVPNTGTNTINNLNSATTRNTIIIYSIFAITIITIYFIISRKRKADRNAIKHTKIVTAAILVLGLIPAIVIAATSENFQFIIDFTNIQFNGPYTITFDTTTTDTIAPQIIDHNAFANKPSDPIKTGYTFDKWLDETNTEFDFTTTKVTKDYNLTAEYTINTYTVTFVTNDNNSQVIFYNVDYNKLVIPPADPVKTGYVFSKWLDENNQEFDFNTPITDNIKLTASYTVGNYPITYNDNGANSPTTMSDQIIKGTDTEVTLWPSNFKYPGRGFAGWNTKADGKGTSFGPNETITDQTVLNDIKTNGLTLYAMWIPSAGDLQTWRGCKAMNVGDVTALTDTRDNNVYAVAKLEDGNCWMIENLRLDNTNSDNATGALAQGYNSSFIGLADPETANFGDTDAKNSLYSTDSSTAAPAITGDGAGSRFPRYNNKSITDPATKMDSAEEPYIYSQGNYYTWPAVIADTSHYATDNQVVADTSICPKGWRLPTGGKYDVVGQNADFHKLAVSVVGEEPHTTEYYGVVYYGETTGVNASNKLRAYPNNFTYDGYYNGNRPSTTRGSRGGYWSSTSAGAQKAYGFGFDVDLVGTGSYTKSLGFPVRCVASNTYTITFDSNGGSGNMSNQIVDSGQTTNLSTNTFTRTNFTFDGWNTKANGTGTDYTDGQEITDLVSADEEITLYAKWYGGNIFYNDNGANSTTKMGNQTITPTSTDALLWASNFKHSDNTKTFIGWNTQADGNGTKYGPNQTILDDAIIKKIKEENITLYAMWIKSEGTMQSWGGCPTMNIGDVKALTDNRDGNVYAIAKLASGKCWMIENLRLTNKHAITGAPVTIDSTNTNNPSPGFTLGDPHDFAAEPWCTTQETTCIGQPHYVATNTTNPVDRMTDPSQNAYSYANYYNFYAATAGTPLVEITDGSTGLKATGDICPAGWRIPITERTGSGDGDYKDLGLALAGGDTSSAAQNYLWQAFPNNFILSGGIFSSATYRNLGSSGSYIANFAWMPAGHSGAVIYATRAVYTSVGNSRYTATSVRCISNI